MTTTVPAHPAVDNLARSLLAVAAELEATEQAIKRELLEAARIGDCGRIVSLVTRWLDGPAGDVLDQSPPASKKSGKKARNGLEDRGDVEVKVTSSQEAPAAR